MTVEFATAIARDGATSCQQGARQPAFQPMHLRRPTGQEVDAGIHQRPLEGGSRHGRGRLVQQGACDLAGSLVASKCRTYACQILLHLLPALRHRCGAQKLGYDRNLGVIAVLLGKGQVRVAIADEGLEEAADLRDMHPGQEVGVVRGIRRAVGQGALDPVMDLPHPFDEAHGLLGRRVGRAADELRRALQPPGHIFAEIGMVPDTGQRTRMQHLQEQRRDTADHHGGEIAVDLPCHAIQPEQPLVADGMVEIDLARCEAHELADVPPDRIPGTHQQGCALLQ